MQKPSETVDVPIQKFSAKGYGIGFLPVGKEIEIAHAAPGDIVRVEWRKKREDPQKGRLLEVLTPSSTRIVPRCSHATVCGGCSWQQIRYDVQLQEKMERVKKAFGNHAVDPIIPCSNPFGYRNKMEFTFSQNGARTRFLGLMIAQAAPYVFNVNECHLCAPWFSSAVASVRNWWENTELEAYRPSKDCGTLRYLTLRESVRMKQKMAVLNISGHSAYAPTRSDLDGFTAAIRNVAEDASIFLCIHQTKKGRPTQFVETRLAGPDHMIEQLHIAQSILSFKISPVSFFQPNTLQAEKLYDTALSLLEHPSVIYDLYCGTGTLGMAASRIAKKVIGIELSPEAVLDAKENLRFNGIQNMEIHQGDVGQTMRKFMASPSFCNPDAVLVDPPRAGLDPLAIQHLKYLSPRTIVYISCNPITQAANIKELVQAGYRIRRLQPVDQFPHTYHIENIALLEK
ncbi:MAG TPA: 23S rRNA (uracil(1939)-C(5))-methyltransferase RlmD [Chlamydiales bacterium]|nr:23S rRNA (uracil(1939)-C(5))-methyltransferase RlmD [Chlamydiales bacterium]